MSLASGAYVYTGAWIDWTKGRIQGSTITLSQRNGSLLTAFLGIFVTVAGASFWRILCFLVHQYQAKPRLFDAAHHQQQAILRNSSTPGSAAWQLTQLGWSWRKISKKPLWRGIPLVVLALLNMTLFGIAGIFSAEVTKAVGNETLIRSPNCGYLLPNFNSNDSSFENLAAFNSLSANDTLAATAYTGACYEDASNKPQCHQYVLSSIPWKSNRDISCPFGNGICKDVPAFQMDTGFVDSLDALGMNTKTSDRVQYRKVSTCSILRTKEYGEYVNITNSNNQLQQMLRYYYSTSDDPQHNFTFEYNLNDAIGVKSYSLTPLALQGEALQSIPALGREDADVTLMFLATNRVLSQDPVLDPWFRATLPVDFQDPYGINVTQYSADYWVSVLGCADQFQFRNPATGRETPLTSYSVVSNSVSQLALTELQQAMVTSLVYSAGFQGSYEVMRNRGASALRASDTLDLSTSTQIGLPEDQWIIEATHMFSISMAKLQQQAIHYATGPSSFPDHMEFSRGDPNLCNRQKICGVAGYTSFSLLGIAIILIIGGTLFITGLFIDTFVGFIRQKLGWRDHKRLQWAIDEKLQLQRQAFEGIGQGRWMGGADAVPVTRTSDEIFGFDPSRVDKSRPRFSRQLQHRDSALESESLNSESWKMPSSRTTEVRAYSDV